MNSVDGAEFPVELEIEAVNDDNFPTPYILIPKNYNEQSDTDVDVIDLKQIKQISSISGITNRVSLKLKSAKEAKQIVEKVVKKVQSILSEWEKHFEDVTSQNLYYDVYSDTIEKNEKIIE